MGQCVTKLSNLFEETEPAPHSYKASIRAKETAKATHKGNLLLTDTEILFYENKKQEPLYQWELQFIRKYGVEKKIFSLHAGTRTKTGEGQYLFRCRNSEQLVVEMEKRISAMQTKYAPGKFPKPGPGSSSSRQNFEPEPSPTHGTSEPGDGPQTEYENVPLGVTGGDDTEDQNYINVSKPHPKRNSSRQSIQEEANTTPDKYVELEQNPTGSMSPRPAMPSDSRPDLQEINYTEIDIQTTNAMASIAQDL